MALENRILNRYHAQAEQFDEFLSDHTEPFDDLNFFEPYVKHISEIQVIVTECIEYLEELDEEEDDDDDVDYDTLEDEMKENYAERLDEWFNIRAPDLSPKPTPKELESVFNDINAFIEFQYENVKDEGIKLYHVLIGAA